MEAYSGESIENTSLQVGKSFLTVDKCIVAAGIAYLILPIIVFSFGWLRGILALLISVCFTAAGILIWKEIANKKVTDLELDNKRFWIITIIISMIWVYLSGIGSFVFQNSDYWVRNPLFRDLSTMGWPVIYDLSKESAKVQAFCGNTRVALSYYFCWWLPVSAASKLMHLGEFSRGLLLSLWALAGILIVFYLLCRKLEKCSLIVPVVFVLFSGLDYIPIRLLNDTVGLTDHLEWWAGLGVFQYSSNTTLLFWVFNQAIPIWVLMALLLQLKDNKYVAALASLAFAYSPWATFGIVPMAIALSFKRGCIKKIFNPLNVLIPGIMLLLFGSFYMEGSGSSGVINTVFAVNQMDNKRILMTYLVFILFEVLLYFFILGKYAYKYELYKVVLIELLVFPLIIVRDFNFAMRGTIPALFMLTYYVTVFLLDYEKETDRNIRVRYVALIIALCIGSITPIHEISRTVKKTMQTDDMLQETVGSFSDMKTDDDLAIVVARDQFFVYDYENKFFFKYLAKK